MSGGYLGYPSEDQYHEHYTLMALLERETVRSEKAAIRRRIREIVAARKALAS